MHCSIIYLFINLMILNDTHSVEWNGHVFPLLLFGQAQASLLVNSMQYMQINQCVSMSDMSLCDLCSRYSYNMIESNVYQRNVMIMSYVNVMSLHLTAACSLITHPHCSASEFKHFRNNNWKICCQKCCLSMINICCCEREGRRLEGEG